MRLQRYLRHKYVYEQLDEGEMVLEGYQVKMRKPEKYKKLNPKTNRMKTSRKQRFLETDIPPEKRSFKNMPKYADGSSKVRFTDWLGIETSKDGKRAGQWGWSKNGKCYGWSHRAVYGFKAGDKITAKDYIGRDIIKKDPPFTIKSDKEAEEMAKAFAEDVS